MWENVPDRGQVDSGSAAPASPSRHSPGRISICQARPSVRTCRAPPRAKGWFHSDGVRACGSPVFAVPLWGDVHEARSSENSRQLPRLGGVSRGENHGTQSVRGEDDGIICKDRRESGLRRVNYRNHMTRPADREAFSGRPREPWPVGNRNSASGSKSDPEASAAMTGGPDGTWAAAGVRSPSEALESKGQRPMDPSQATS